jgi:hypothetical protein
LGVVGFSGFGGAIGTIHAHVLTSQRGVASQYSINPIGLTIEIGSVRDGDYAAVLSRTRVQTDEVSAIACENGTTEARREGELLRIAGELVRLSRF